MRCNDADRGVQFRRGCAASARAAAPEIAALSLRLTGRERVLRLHKRLLGAAWSQYRTL